MSWRRPGGDELLHDVSFHVGNGQRAALIGANGVGKSTLLRMITGELRPSEGTVTIDGRLGVMRQLVGTADRSPGRADHRAPAAGLGQRAAASGGRRCAGAGRASGGRGADALRRGTRRLGRPRRLRRRGAVGRVRDAGARRRPDAGRIPPAADVLRRGAEALGARGAAARARRRAAAGRAGQLPRRAGEALARARARRYAQDGPLREPRPGAAGGDGHTHRDRRADRRVDPRRGLRRVRLGAPAAPRHAGQGSSAVRRRAPAAGGLRRPDAAAGEDLGQLRTQAQGGRDAAAPLRRTHRAPGRRPRPARRHAPRRRPHGQAGGDRRAARAGRAHRRLRPRAVVR